MATVNAKCGVRGIEQPGAGKIEVELQDIVGDMTMMALSSLTIHHGVLLSDEGKTGLRKVIYDYVHQSVEIEAKVIELMDRPPAA